ncbi:MAG: glutamate--tRNA ligase [Planctomycetales bacterium]|nr:glutamate--tRNA ligase [Planctomycetales bacterium]
MTVRTRFAPSPTGYLHIGGVRTALFNWLLARQAGGQFILRIDDTDAQRNVSAALAPILAGFQWLGLDWDEGPTADGTDSHGPYGPYFQSQRGELYQQAAARLLASGHAYRDFARPEELQAQRQAAEKAGRTFVYNRQWMAENDAQAEKFVAEGRTAVVRLKMPRSGSCTFQDEIRGGVEFAWGEEQDHVIQRADGSCLYHLASVVDDAAMKITHVVRAIEHLSNTPRQIFIAQSLGYDLPTYAHLPFVAEPGGTAKMSKRKLDKYLKQKDFAALFEVGQRVADRTGMLVEKETFNPVLVDFYQTIGFLPAAILNYLLLLGWSLDDSTEDFSREQMIELFSLSRVTKSPASFDPQKLVAFQGRWMHQLPLTEKLDRCLPYLQAAHCIADSRDPSTRDYVAQVLTAAHDRIKLASDILDYDDFFTADEDLAYDPTAFEKRLRQDEPARQLLQKFRQQLASLEPFTVASTEACLKSFVEAEGIKFNQIIHALRVAVTGKAVGFGMFDALAILGSVRSLARIDRALALSSQAAD